MNANYALLEANSAEYSTGLFDNWSDAKGKGLDGNYGYDAARTPWRLAQDFYWFGESKAKTMLDKLGTWVSSKAAKDIRGNINRNGSAEGWAAHNSTFVATLMASLVTDASRQGKLDEFWSEAVSLGEEAYFEQSLKILCGLLVSGNMPNFMNPPSAPTSSSSVPGSSSSVVPPQSSSSVVGPEVSSSSVQALPLDRAVIAPSLSMQGRTLHVSTSGTARVDLFNLTGSVVKTLWSGHVGGSIDLGLQGIAGGVYVVRMQTQFGTIMQKVRFE